ncbi:MAG: ATP-binding protein [Bacteroidetes bacterium]|nr:ATP-binding protein [Bacteroidota bacterium]
MNKIDGKLQLLKPVLGTRKTDGIRQLYFLADDFKERAEVENYIDLLLSRLVKTQPENEIILPPPLQQFCNGEVLLGNIEYLGKTIRPFSLTFKDINRHLGIFGSTGSGKTTLALGVIKQLQRNNIPFLIIDWEKSYRDLVNHYQDVEVFTVGRSDINPLFLNILTVPPGITYEEYAKSLIAIIAEDYLSGHGSDSMLLQFIMQTFSMYQNPTFYNLKETILNEIQKEISRKGRLSGRKGLWLQTTERIALALSLGAIGSVLTSKKHFPIEKLFNRPIVLELGNIKSPHDRKFIVHVILNYLSFHNEYTGIHSEKLKNVIIFEEFHNIAIQSHEDNMVSNLFRECRKYGVGLIAIDQTPSEIPNAIFANMNTKVSFSLGTNQDITAMGRAMNLPNEQLSFLGMQKTGQAVVSVRQNIATPFLIKAPFIKAAPFCSDLDLKQAMLVFSEDFHVICTPNLKSSTSQSSHNNDTFSPSRRATINGLEKIVISDIIARPFDGVDRRTKRLGLHPGEMKAKHDSLVKNNIIKPVPIDGRKLFEVTDQGRIILQRQGVKMSKSNQGRGGLEHAYVIKKIFDHLIKLGLKPKKEVNGIDIVVPTPSPLLAIEVETGKSNLYTNILKLKNSQVSARFMIATSRKALVTIKKITRAFPQIKPIYFKDFLKLTKKKIIS